MKTTFLQQEKKKKKISEDCRAWRHLRQGKSKLPSVYLQSQMEQGALPDLQMSWNKFHSLLICVPAFPLLLTYNSDLSCSCRSNAVVKLSKSHLSSKCLRTRMSCGLNKAVTGFFSGLPLFCFWPVVINCLGIFPPAWDLNTGKLLLEDGWIYNRPTAFSTMCSSSDHSILCTLLVWK